MTDTERAVAIVERAGLQAEVRSPRCLLAYRADRQGRRQELRYVDVDGLLASDAPLSYVHRCYKLGGAS